MSKRIQTSIVTKARRTELVDAQQVVKYVNKQTLDLFGTNVKELGKIYELIEKSVLSITLEDDQSSRFLAQACFYDYPNTASVQPKFWEQWLNKNYESSKITSFNTLFLNFFVAQPEFSLGCAEEVIRSAFKAVPECHYILLCAPISVVPEASLAALFNEIKRLSYENNEEAILTQNTAVFVANRDKFVPVLHVRESNVRDNDDLSPLFNSYNNMLKATYGDFYVAEMIEAQNENNKCLTAEGEGFGIGFMAITDDVNCKLLNECFELQPFHGLCEPHCDDILQPVVEERPADEFEDDDSDIVISSEKTSKVQVNSKVRLSQQNSKISFDDTVPEIKHKLSDVGLNIQSTDLENGTESNQDNISHRSAEESKSNLSSYSVQKVASQTLKKKNSFVPHYAGNSKAFAIQLFCIEEKYESRSLDFLQRAFDMFPEKDFCIITLPPNVPEFALVQNFFRVTPKITNKLNQELYLFHRAGLAKNFVVREANKPGDYEAVEELTKNLNSKVQILCDFQAYLNSRKDPNGVDIQAFVTEVLGRVVGFAIIRSEEDIEYLRSNFNIDDFIYFTHHKREEHGHINHFSLIPIFSFLTKFFIREIMRNSNKTSFYYPIYPEYAPVDLLDQYSLISSLNFMVPVKKRRQIDYNTQKLGVNLPSSHVLSQKNNYKIPCALNHINRKLLLEPKIAINLRIVVVGASELAISFLETLTFCPHLRFNNITLVSANGLPGMLSPDDLRDNMKAQSMNYDQKDHAYMSLRSWVNVIVGKLTNIDRRKKNIYINEQTILPYDHLILCTGEQYYHIAPLQNRVYNWYAKKDVKPHISRPLFDIPPENMFVINNEYEAENLLIYIEHNHLLNSKENIVIYGMDLNVLSMLHSLNKIGIDSSRIHIFCDKNANNQFSINNTYVSSKIHEVLTELKVNVHKSYNLDDWNNGRWSSGLNVKTVTFVKNSENNEDGSPRVIQLECCLFLCYFRRDVDYSAFIAANSSSLVYDGRLVVDNNFHTNDSCIRAAGKMAKYKRSYYVENWSHGCFNQKEVGVDLAINILKLVDPTIVSYENDDGLSESARLSANEPSDKVLISLYKKPLIFLTILPGNYHYLNVTKPGLFVPYEEEKTEGKELITNTENGYFRIHLDKHDIVQTITCFSKKTFSASNFSRLYGLHEKFLNKLLLKYENKTISDFYIYFSENWCTALYHDRFEDLCKEIRELSTKSTIGLKPVSDLLRDQVDRDLILTNEQRKTINEYFVTSQTKSLVEKHLLNYINYNSNHLPMYAKPDMV